MIDTYTRLYQPNLIQLICKHNSTQICIRLLLESDSLRTVMSTISKWHQGEIDWRCKNCYSQGMLATSASLKSYLLHSIQKLGTYFSFNPSEGLLFDIVGLLTHDARGSCHFILRTRNEEAHACLFNASFVWINCIPLFLNPRYSAITLLWKEIISQWINFISKKLQNGEQW